MLQSPSAWGHESNSVMLGFLHAIRLQVVGIVTYSGCLTRAYFRWKVGNELSKDLRKVRNWLDAGLKKCYRWEWGLGYKRTEKNEFLFEVDDSIEENTTEPLRHANLFAEVLLGRAPRTNSDTPWKQEGKNGNFELFQQQNNEKSLVFIGRLFRSLKVSCEELRNESLDKW